MLRCSVCVMWLVSVLWLWFMLWCSVCVMWLVYVMVMFMLWCNRDSVPCFSVGYMRQFLQFIPQLIRSCLSFVVIHRSQNILKKYIPRLSVYFLFVNSLIFVLKLCSLGFLRVVVIDDFVWSYDLLNVKLLSSLDSSSRRPLIKFINFPAIEFWRCVFTALVVGSFSINVDWFESNGLRKPISCLE